MLPNSLSPMNHFQIMELTQLIDDKEAGLLTESLQEIIINFAARENISVDVVLNHLRKK